jgi:hypothetical protein
MLLFQYKYLLSIVMLYHNKELNLIVHLDWDDKG